MIFEMPFCIPETMDIRNTHRQISFSLFFTVGRRQLYDSKKEFSLLPQRQAAFSCV